ncbi:MAG: hypothetical protein R2939_19745 [Kofleriaceae bacterium]
MAQRSLRCDDSHVAPSTAAPARPPDALTPPYLHLGLHARGGGLRRLLEGSAAPDAGGSGGDGGGGGNPLARAAFDDDVYPILSAKCASCHGTTSPVSTPFVSSDPSNAYEYVVGSNAVGSFTTSGAPLYYKVVPGPHQGTSYTPAEQGAIQAWFDAELAGGGGGGGGGGGLTPAQVTANLVSEWSGCLTQTDFVEVGFGQAWGDKAAGGGTCSLCHSAGAFGFLASLDDAQMYETISTNKYYLGSYFAADIADLNNARMVPNFAKFDRVGTGQVPYEDHPSFGTSPTDPAYLVLQELYDLTMARKAAGTCGPPRIPAT